MDLENSVNNWACQMEIHSPCGWMGPNTLDPLLHMFLLLFQRSFSLLADTCRLLEVYISPKGRVDGTGFLSRGREVR
jgi:hypothetical protein